MNVLVLDFDGVVNNDSSIEQNTRYVINPTDLETSYIHYFVPQLIRNIKQLCDKFDFKIVISSTWRIDFSIEEMKSIFKNQFSIDQEIIGYTTTKFLDHTYRSRLEDTNGYVQCYDRGLQITKYLEDNQLQDCNYLVVDDSYDAGYGHTDNFFRVNPQVGFNETHLAECITFFEGIINNAN